MKTREGNIYVGVAGRATEVVFTTEPSDKPDVSATLASWFLDCPGQSPAWRHYHLCVVHLRTIPGVKDAHIEREGATHEIMLFALDPRTNPVVENIETWNWLKPINFVGQLRLPSDEDAKRVIEILAKAVVDGILWAEPPLSGQREPWKTQLRHLEDHAVGKHSS